MEIGRPPAWSWVPTRGELEWTGVCDLLVLSPHADERREGEGSQADVLSLHLPVFGETGDEGDATHRPVPVVGPGPGAADTNDLEGPFVLSEALPVVPAKLVKRILKRGELVDMVELLKDNMEAERRFVAEGTGGLTHFTNHQSRRDIALFQPICSCSVLKAPGEDQTTVGIPSHNDCGGKEVWRSGVGLVGSKWRPLSH